MENSSLLLDFVFLGHVSGEIAHTLKGEVKMSEKDLLTALDICKMLKSPIEDGMATTLNNSGVLYHSSRNHDKARECLEESLAIQWKREPSEIRDMSITMAQHKSRSHL